MPHKLKNALLALGAAFALAGCMNDPYELALASIDLADDHEVVDVIAALDRADRGPFRSYLLHHLATSSSFCGERLIDATGKEPVTVGEAILLTKQRDARRAIALKPLVEQGYSEVAIKQIALDELSDRREELLMQRQDYKLSLPPDTDLSQEPYLQLLERDLQDNTAATVIAKSALEAVKSN